MKRSLFLISGLIATVYLYDLVRMNTLPLGTHLVTTRDERLPSPPGGMTCYGHSRCLHPRTERDFKTVIQSTYFGSLTTD